MIAQVVPVTRLRRDTTWWSYRLPPRAICTAGSLVVIPFRGGSCLGVIWHLEDQDAHARKEVKEILTSGPLLRLPHRRYIEWLSQQGFCSLSTALYQWMPAGIRRYPLSSAARKLLKEYSPRQATTSTSPPAQQGILTPGRRDWQAAQLSQRFTGRFTQLFADPTETEGLERWQGISNGTTVAGLGREGALSAPWLNLRTLTITDPEDISYYHEQVPYLSLVTAGQALASFFQATCRLRTSLPQEVATAVWGTEALGSGEDGLIPELVDLRHHPLLGPPLLERIQATLQQGRRVLILQNQHDHTALIQRHGQTERIAIPGIETTAKRLAHLLELPHPSPNLLVGTRTLLHRPLTNLGLTVALHIDHLVSETVFADQLHGFADLYRLFALKVPCLIQSSRLDHPAVQAMGQGRLSQWLLTRIEDQRRLGLPPFGQQIVCSYPDQEGSRTVVEQARNTLTPLLGSTWLLSHPFTAFWRRKPYLHLLLHADTATTRLPVAARSILVELPRPWKVQRDPWYLL